MTMFLVVAAPFLIILAVLSVADVIRNVNGGWSIAAWVAFIVVVPVIGSAVYWLTRKAAPGIAEASYQAHADEQRQRERAPIDRSGY